MGFNECRLTVHLHVLCDNVAAMGVTRLTLAARCSAVRPSVLGRSTSHLLWMRKVRRHVSLSLSLRLTKAWRGASPFSSRASGSGEPWSSFRSCWGKEGGREGRREGGREGGWEGKVSK